MRLQMIKLPKFIWYISVFLFLSLACASIIVGNLVYQFFRPEKILVRNVVGTYLTEDSQEKQKLTLFANGNYVQIVNRHAGATYTNSGKWKLDYGTGDPDLIYVELQNAVILSSHNKGVWSLVVSHSITGKRVLEIDSDQGQSFERVSS